MLVLTTFVDTDAGLIRCYSTCPGKDKETAAREAARRVAFRGTVRHTVVLEMGDSLVTGADLADQPVTEERYALLRDTALKSGFLFTAGGSRIVLLQIQEG